MFAGTEWNACISLVFAHYLTFICSFAFFGALTYNMKDFEF